MYGFQGGAELNSLLRFLQATSPCLNPGKMREKECFELPGILLAAEGCSDGDEMRLLVLREAGQKFAHMLLQIVPGKALGVVMIQGAFHEDERIGEPYLGIHQEGEIGLDESVSVGRAEQLQEIASQSLVVCSEEACFNPGSPPSDAVRTAAETLAETLLAGL